MGSERDIVSYLVEGWLCRSSHLTTSPGGVPFLFQVQKTYKVELGRGVFSVSDDGVLAYQTGSATSNLQLTWFDRSGKLLGVLDDPAPNANPKLSPDGKRLAVVITDPQTGRPDIWLYELARGIKTRFTFDPAGEREPVWSPDGSRIVFASNRKGHFDLYQKAASGLGSEEILLESNFDKTPSSFSPDGRHLLYVTVDPKTKADLWALPLGGTGNHSRSYRRSSPNLSVNFPLTGDGSHTAPMSPAGGDLCRALSGSRRPAASFHCRGQTAEMARQRQRAFLPGPG